MLTVKQLTHDRVFTHLELPVIHATLAIPVISETPTTHGTHGDTPRLLSLSDCGDTPRLFSLPERGVRRINAFYAHMAQAILKHSEHVLLPRAARQLAAAVAQSRSFEPFRIKLSFTLEPSEDGRELVITHNVYANFGTITASPASHASQNTVTNAHDSRRKAFRKKPREGGRQDPPYASQSAALDERERSFVTVWDARTGLVLHTHDSELNYLHY